MRIILAPFVIAALILGLLLMLLLGALVCMAGVVRQSALSLRRMQPFKFMTVFLLLWILLVTVASANPQKKRSRQLRRYAKANNIHWHQTKRTATGKYSYYKPGWGYSDTCPWHPNLPTKESTFKRMVYWKPSLFWNQ